MKKYIIIPIVFVLLIILTIPWIMGYQYKKHYLGLIHDNVPENKQIKTNITFNRGWFHSQAKIETTIFDATNKPEFIITSEDLITHGPFVYDPIKKGYTFAVAVSNNRVSFSYVHAGPNKVIGVMNNNMVMYFGRRINAAFNIPQLSYPDIKWQELKGTYNVQLEADKIKTESSNIQINALSLSNNMSTANNQVSTIDVPSINLTCDLTRSSVLPEGQCAFTMPKMLLKFNDQSSAAINGFAIKKNTSISGDNYSEVIDININKIDAPQFTIPSATAFALKLSANNINIAPLKTKNPSIYALYGFPAHSGMLKPATTLAMSFGFNSTFGTLNMQSTANWKALAMHTATNLSELVPYTHIDANLKVSIPLTNKLAEIIVPFIPDYMSKLKQTVALSNPLLATSQDAKDIFDKEVAILVQHNQIELPEAINIMNAHDNHVSNETFKTDVEALHISSENKTALIAAHEKSDQLLATAANAQENLSNEQLSTLLVNDWLKRVYLIKKDNDYIANIIFDAGKWQINGHAFQ